MDLRVFPDGGFKVLDRNEYRYHKKIMRYTKELDLIIEKSLQELIELKKAKKGAFGPNVVNEYYKNFKEIEEQEQNNDW